MSLAGGETHENVEPGPEVRERAEPEGLATTLRSSLLATPGQGRPGEAFAFTLPDTCPSKPARAHRKLTLAGRSEATQLDLEAGRMSRGKRG